MKVLHVVPVAPNGGTSGFTQRQIDRLTEAGIEGRVVFFGGSAMLTRPHLLFGGIVTIRREIQTFRPDIVHAHWGSVLAFATAVAAISGPPLVISYRGSDINPVPSEARVRSMIRVACSQCAALWADAIICVSEGLRGLLWSCRARARTRVILDGTNLNLFFPRDRAETRRLLMWPEDEPVVLFYAGKNPKVKRLDLAEASVAQARLRIDRLRFEVMWGNVPYDEVPLRINAADCLLMTSDYEGSPNIVREALACNVPVISVDVGDVRRWLTNLIGTRIVPRDPVAIGNALVDIISSGARVSVESNALCFSDETSRYAILEMYRQMIENSKKKNQQ